MKIFRLLWIVTAEKIAGLEELFFRFQWYRKRKGGVWELVCYDKQIYWHPANDFVSFMAEFGIIADVIKTENWS